MGSTTVLPSLRDRDRLAAWGLVLAGVLLVAAVPDLLAGLPRTARLWLSVLGGSAAFAGAIWDDTVCRRRRDERQAEIHYRAGYNAALALVALFGTLFFAMVNLGVRPGPLVVWALTMAALPAYFGSVAYYRRAM